MNTFFPYYRNWCTWFYLVLMIHIVLSVSVNDFYSFGVENGDTARQTEEFTDLIFSNFSITNLLKHENITATSARVC